jgi:hypothetical protein
VDDSPNAWPQNPNVWYFNKFMQITVSSLCYASTAFTTAIAVLFAAVSVFNHCLSVIAMTPYACVLSMLL